MKTNDILAGESVCIEELPLAFAVVRLDHSRLCLLMANSLYYRMIGYSPEEYRSLETNESGFRLAGAEYAEGLIQCMRERLRSMDSFAMSMEFGTKDGESKCFRVNFIKAKEEGDAYLLNCVLENMDDVGSAFHQYVQKINRLDTVVSISANAIFEYSSANKTMAFFTNKNGRFSEKKAISEEFEQVFKENGAVYEDDIDSFEQLCDNIRSGIDRVAFEMRFSFEGEYRWYRVKMKTIKDEADPERFKVIGKFEDVSDMKNAERRLIAKAERDPLTQIYNKATTKKLIKNYLRIDSRDTFDAFMIIDVDNFKQINDTFGHLFGDSVLVDLSQEMQDLFRTNDVVGRIGGDEFIVFLRGLKHIGHIENKAKDICKIFDLLYSDENGTKITGSLGIALFPQDGDTFDELYKRADTALYTSKRAGKSCYTFYDKEKDFSEMPALPRVEQYRGSMDFLNQNTDFSISLLSSAFDLSEKRVDGETVNDLFRKAGKHFALGRISVYEADGKGSFLVTRQWCRKKFEPTVGKSVLFSEEEFSDFIHQFDSNGIYIGNGGSFGRFLTEQGVCSCIASGRFLEGNLSGLIAFEECVSPRIWSFEEARAADTLKRLYFYFFSRVLEKEG